jgi:hypothetical protein
MVCAAGPGRQSDPDELLARVDALPVDEERRTHISSTLRTMIDND